MKKILIPIILLCAILFIIYAFAQNTNSKSVQNNVQHSNQKLEIPNPISGEVIVEHYAYTLSYNSDYKQANWVAYQLTKAETVSEFNRGNRFTADPEIKNTSFNKDYTKSGYDRGHLAPAGDMGWSEQSMKESFYYTNMGPQVPNFNRGVWKNLESLVRNWAIVEDDIYIVTGGVLKGEMSYIGEDRISIPNYYYKVILVMHQIPNKKQVVAKSIGFILPNAATESKYQLQSYAVTIDSVEQVTGIDFFPVLPDKIENSIEKSSKFYDWKWEF
jgi:endonuclease G